MAAARHLSGNDVHAFSYDTVSVSDSLLTIAAASDIESGSQFKASMGKLPNGAQAARSWIDTLYRTWGMDRRSLALYRGAKASVMLRRERSEATSAVLLAAVIVIDVLDRMTDLRAHYSDEGYVPRRLSVTSWALPSQIWY